MPDVIRQYPPTPDGLPKVLFDKAYTDSPPVPEPDSAASRCVVRKSSNSVKKQGVIMLNSEGKVADSSMPMNPLQQMQQMHMQQQMMMRFMMHRMNGGQAGDMTDSPGNPGNAMPMFNMGMPPNIGCMGQMPAGSNMGSMDNFMFGMPSDSTGGSTGNGLHSLKPRGRKALPAPQAIHDAAGQDAPDDDHDKDDPGQDAEDNEQKADGAKLPDGAPAAPVQDHLQAMRAALNAAQPAKAKGKAKAKAKGKAKAKTESKAKATAKGKATTAAKHTSAADQVSKMTHGWSSIIVTRPTGQKDTYYKHADSKRLRSKQEVADFCKANKVKSPF